jgi:ABC-type uncharacterized transport system ATPase component
MKLEAWIREIEFQNGLKLELDCDAVLIVVGPNNSGKSSVLADVRTLLDGEPRKLVVLRQLALQRVTTVKEMKAELQPFLNRQGRYDAPGANFMPRHLDEWWSRDDHPIRTFLCNQLLSELKTRSRLTDCDAPPSFDTRHAMTAAHPFQIMYRDDGTELKVSNAFRRAFKTDLIVHRAAGNTVPLYVGDRPGQVAGEDRVSRSYLDKLEKLEALEGQGDGVRAFVSVVSRVLTEDKAVLLIDEPEAFLHPPQARLIAEIVVSGGYSTEVGSPDTKVEALKNTKQSIVATHSGDVLQGALQQAPQRVNVVRLTRKGSKATATHLSNPKIAALWKDPILRFSNILDGLFHDGVLVAESDGDCRFYSALASIVVPREARPDIYYTYSGGKDRAHVVVAALAGLGVPVATVVDFDVLNNRQTVRRIVHASGGDWSAFEADWEIVRAAIEGKDAYVGGSEFKVSIRRSLDEYDSNLPVPKKILSDIRQLTRNASPWDRIKDVGLAGIPAGVATQAATRLLSNLKAIGVFVAPNGQMEGFYKASSLHGIRWVEHVLQLALNDEPQLSAARQFVAEIYSFFRVRI